MKKQLIALMFILGLSVSLSYAQKITIKSGNLSVLKGEKELNAKYDYSEMGVGDFENEADYIKKKTKDYNAKEPGRGDDWAKHWTGDRKSQYEPKFEELFSDHSGIDLDDNPEAKYTLIFKTTFTEPGFNVYVSRRNAEISGEALIVETANESNVLCKITVQKAPGRTFGGNDYDTGIRLAEAYAKAGKELGSMVADAMKSKK